MLGLLLTGMIYVSPVRHSVVPPTTTTTVTTTTIPTDTPAALPNWTANMLAVWNCEEATTAEDIIDVTGSGDNDLGSNGVARNTALFRQGAKSCKFVDAENDYADCADISCGPDFDLGDAAISYGGWFYTDQDTADRTFMSKSSTGSFKGFELQREFSSPNDSVRCRIGDATAFNSDTAAADVWPASTWVFAVCSYDPTTASELAALVATSSSFSATNADVFSNATAADFKLGTDLSNLQADNVFVDGAAWHYTDVCRAASCGIDGSLCKRSTADPTMYFDCTNNSDCGGSAICDTPLVEDNCVSPPCCVGQNVSAAGDCNLPPANESAP